MGTGRRVLLWLARERPASPSPLLRGLTKAILWLVPVTVLAVVIARAVTMPDPPSGELGTAYPDLCAVTPAASVSALVGGDAYTSRMVSRDGAECAWQPDPDAPRTRLDVKAERVDRYSDQSEEAAARAAFGRAVELAGILYDDAGETALHGLGDEAAWFGASGDGRTEVTIVVRSGRRLVSAEVSMADRPMETVRPAVEDLVRALLPLLPED